MLQLLRRRRRDELTPYEAEIVRQERLSIPGHPVPVGRGELLAVLRHKRVVVVAGVVLSGSMLFGAYWAGATLEERRADAELEARIDEAFAERSGLMSALGELHAAELEERGILPLEDHERRGLMDELDVMEANPPRDPATLSVRQRFDEADAKYEALAVQKD